MIKDLIILANRLDSKGLQKEADIVDRMILSLAKEDDGFDSEDFRDALMDVIIMRKIINIDSKKPDLLALPLYFFEDEGSTELTEGQVKEALFGLKGLSPGDESKKGVSYDYEVGANEPKYLGEVMPLAEGPKHSIVMSKKKIVNGKPMIYRVRATITLMLDEENKKIGRLEIKRLPNAM